MKLKELYFALCRGYREIVDFLKEPYVPINPEESISKKEKKERPVKKERKKFPRDEAKKLFLAGSSYAEIGRGYGISRVAVWRALNE